MSAVRDVCRNDESPDFYAADMTPIDRLSDRAISVGLEALASDCYVSAQPFQRPPTAQGVAFMELLRTGTAAQIKSALVEFIENYANDNPEDVA